MERPAPNPSPGTVSPGEPYRERVGPASTPSPPREAPCAGGPARADPDLWHVV